MSLYPGRQKARSSAHGKIRLCLQIHKHSPKRNAFAQMAMPGQRQLGTACKELEEKPGNADAKIGLISVLAQASPTPLSLLSTVLTTAPVQSANQMAVFL